MDGHSIQGARLTIDDDSLRRVETLPKPTSDQLPRAITLGFTTNAN